MDHSVHFQVWQCAMKQVIWAVDEDEHEDEDEAEDDDEHEDEDEDEDEDDHEHEDEDVDEHGHEDEDEEEYGRGQIFHRCELADVGEDKICSFSLVVSWQM